MAYKNNQNDEVFNKIAELLEKGTVPWVKPWNCDGVLPQNGVSGHKYRGLNFFITSFLHPEDPRFYTVKQFVMLGGRVPEDDFKNFTPVSFWKLTKIETDKTDENGEPVFFMKWTCKNWRVYNYSQIKWLKGEPPALEIFKREHNANEEIESFIVASELKINREEAQVRAFYRPSEHAIHLPIAERFIDDKGFYSTVFHEMIHATGHESLLNRNLKNMFGSENYAFEELIAEMGAAMLCARFGIDNTDFNQSAAYIADWLKAIKKTPSALSKAATAANKAVEFLLSKFDGPAISESESHEE